MTTFEPYLFQRRVADLLLSGRNVILQAPTGAGKTWAAKLPYYEARKEGLDFPRKCIYAVPMRVLANQFLADTKKEDAPFETNIQTGERPKDPMFEADMTFATIDQVLSGFLLMPYGLSRRMANMNAGAVASSYLVFDEFHLFDPLSTLPTTLEMLRILNRVVPFLLMTATFSREMLQGLAEALDAVVVPESDEDREAMQTLGSQRKTRRYQVCDEPLSADALLAHRRGRTLVICNVVARAQRLHRALREHPGLGDTRLLLLHSRFLPEDRARIEQEIRCAYAKGVKGENRITVATQAIEVGLDITCDTMHTELAPANAILQRAGRCARYEGETGDVYIYAHSFDPEGEMVNLAERVLPYRGMEPECAETLRAFSATDGQALCFGDEQDLVSQVHGPRDKRTVEGLIGTREVHQQMMNGVLRGEHSGRGADLIRQVSSKRIVVHDKPNTVLEAPFAFESFGLHTGSAYGLVKAWLKRTDLEELDAVGLHALHDMGDADESGRTHYGFIPVHKVQDAAGAVMILVHPHLATYDPQMGFLSDQGGRYVAQRQADSEQKEYERYGYRLEPYNAHAELVLRASRRFWPEVAYAAKRLESKYGWPWGMLHRVAEIIALLHDTGKLSRGWQGWVRGYQQAIGKPISESYYAHTDRDPDDQAHSAAERAQGRRPTHAVESAVASIPLLLGSTEEILPVTKAAFTAIARHHGPFSRSYQRYRLEPGADDVVHSLLTQLEGVSSWASAGVLTGATPEEDSIDELFIDPQFNEELLAYVLLTRILRLADHQATAEGSAPAPGKP